MGMSRKGWSPKMKFSELDEAGWADLQNYLDTCLLPVSGLRGDEPPWEMTEKAAGAGAWLTPLEQSFKGRTVTLPAYHYYDGGESSADKLRALVAGFRRAGFRYVVIVGGSPGLLRGDEGADLVVQPETEGGSPDADAIRRTVSELWRTGRA